MISLAIPANGNKEFVQKSHPNAPSTLNFTSQLCPIFNKRLARNAIGDAGCRAIADSLRECSSKVKEISLYDNMIGNDGAKALAMLLCDEVRGRIAKTSITVASSTRRNALTHHRTKRNKKTPPFGKLMHLEKISLFNNSIGDAGVEALAAALTDNTSLQTLYLDNNNIHDAGCRELAAAIRKNKHLKRLDIQRNKITEAGGACLENALGHNITLVELACRWNDGLTVKQRRAIDRHCQDNRNFAQLIEINARDTFQLDPCHNLNANCSVSGRTRSSIPLSMWPRALQVIRHRPDMLHAWLKMKPELFLLASGITDAKLDLKDGTFGVDR